LLLAVAMFPELIILFSDCETGSADITMFNGGIPGLLEKNHQEIAWRIWLISHLFTAVITSGRTTRKLLRVNMKHCQKLSRCALMCSLWPGRWQPAVS
jgi:hypothetical protein